MAKYNVHVSIESETGTRHPAEDRVSWSCTLLPATHISGGTVIHSRPSESDGEICGVYEAIKHAEANGETLTRGDIDVVIARVTHVLKRQNVAGVSERDLV